MHDAFMNWILHHLLIKGSKTNFIFNDQFFASEVKVFSTVSQ